MIIAFLIFAIVCIIAAIITTKIDDGPSAMFSTFAFIAICLSIAAIIVTDEKPQAIDVYRDRTTLQITYQDSIPTDTVVVFKPEFRK